MQTTPIVIPAGYEVLLLYFKGKLSSILEVFIHLPNNSDQFPCCCFFATKLIIEIAMAFIQVSFSQFLLSTFSFYKGHICGVHNL